MKKKSYKSKRLCEVWLTLAGQWRFRILRRENNEILASGESYIRRIDCINTAKLVTGGRLKVTVLK